MGYIITFLMMTAHSTTPGLVLVGQSLCNGNSSVTEIHTAQDGSSAMLTGNVYDVASGGMLAVTSSWPTFPLVEASYESPRWGIAAGWNDATGGTGPVVMSACVGASAYAAMKRGTVPFERLRWLVESHGAHDGYVAAAIAIHGEADHQAGTTRVTYAANIAEWQTDIQAKARASSRVCPSCVVPLVVKQFSAWTAYSATTSTIPMAQYDAMKNGGGAVVLSGPAYQYTYLGTAPTDGRHLVALSSCAMGYNQGRVAGFLTRDPSWRPLMPTSVTLAGAVITVAFNIPEPPLVVDDVTVDDPGNYGFEYYCASSPPSISDVACGASTCAITLGSVPGAGCTSADVLRYAYTGTAPANGGPTTGPRGVVRDSSAFDGCGGFTDHNWLVHFEESVL